MTVRVLIADDEPLARERVRTFLARHDVEIVGEARDGEEALRMIENESPDLVFLDVQMPALDGFEVLAAVRTSRPPAVVFVTAFDDYAVRAFEVNALDYLVKPFNRARFDAALGRVLSHTPLHAGTLRAMIQNLRPEPKYPTRFVIRSAEEIHFVRVSDVLWLESAGNYVKLHTARAQHLLRGTIRELEETVDPNIFVRVHRSTIVSLDAIEKLEPYFHGELVITLKGGTRIRSSRSYSGKLRKRLL